MSARRMKKLLTDDLKGPESMEEEEDDDDIAPVTFQQRKNPFFALVMDEEDEEDEEEEQETEEQPEPQKIVIAPCPSRKAQNKARKKNKKKKKKQTKKEQEEDLLDQAIAEVAETTKSEGNDPKSNLLGVDTKFLLAANEVKRMFGSDAITDDTQEKRKATQIRNRRGQRRVLPTFKQNTKLTRPDPSTWPPVRVDDLSMIQVDPPERRQDGKGEEKEETEETGIKYFAFKWSSRQESAQQAFAACIETGDPNSLFQLLQQYPYHAGTLLQLSELLKQTGDFQRGAEFIERALYAFECGWHHEFDWKTNKSRILHQHRENRELFYALFRHIQMLGRRGCCRTGLECCKLLLSFDHSDPLFVVGMIDYFAIRAKQYRFLLDFFEKFEKKPILLPNLYYSIALASFLLYQEESEDENQTVTISKQDANVLLQQAIITFPVLLPILLEKCKKTLQHPDTRENLDLSKQIFFSAAYRSPTLFRLVNLYVDRCYSLWTSQPIQIWMAENLVVVLERIARTDPLIEKSAQALCATYPIDGADSFSRIQASDYNDEVASIPADLLEQQAVEAPRRVVPATTGNPLALFLQTLLPWNEVPNAPYQGPEMQLNPADREHFVQQVMEWIGINGNPDDGEDHAEEQEGGDHED